MRIYIKNLEHPDEYQQVINTHTSEDFFIPLPGETIFIDYIVIRREWITFEPGQEKVIIWTELKSKNMVDLVFIEDRLAGFFKEPEKVVIHEEKVLRQDLDKLPGVGVTFEIGDKEYRVVGIRKLGNFLKPTKIEVKVIEV